jgi:hypothetical protein
MPSAHSPISPPAASSSTPAPGSGADIIMHPMPSPITRSHLASALTLLQEPSNGRQRRVFRPPPLGQRLHLISSHARRLGRLDVCSPNPTFARNVTRHQVLAVHRQSFHQRHQRRSRLLLLSRRRSRTRGVDAARCHRQCLTHQPATALTRLSNIDSSSSSPRSCSAVVPDMFVFAK